MKKSIIIIFTIIQTLFVNAQVSWEISSGGISSSVAISEIVVSGDDLFACGTYMNVTTYKSEVRLYKSTDNGSSWSQQSTNGLGLITGNTIFNHNGILFISGAVSLSQEYAVFRNK